MPSHQRPLSPHLQIYRWQLTSVLSILHRGTGLALAAGTLLLAWWLIAAATGPAAFETVQGFLASWLGRLLLLGWSWALFYHLTNGIRHLAWDVGLGFELKTAYVTGWTVVALSFLLTLIAWIAGYAVMAGL
jgi:succinate dehydrogenase / fumarate reductase cytochrome b subunit